ncbi:MAG: HAMP domain-containing sensor histidine kinase [Cyclobacteriaceae bacterium]
MKLHSKFAVYNTLSKIVIIFVFVIIMPVVIKEVAIINTDRQLREKKEQVLFILENEGISSFIEEGSTDGYGSYNLLKEEFISLEEIDSVLDLDGIENSPRVVDEEVVDYRVLSYTFTAGNKQYLLEVARSLSTIQEIESTLRRFALITLVIISLVTILIDVAFTEYLLRPLKAIIRKLHATKDPSSFTFKSVETNTTDFQYLDDSIHDMMNRIEDVFLKERQFISNVSHELLTPISIIQGKLENLLGNENLSEAGEVRLVETQKTITRLKNVVRTLLLISKIENDQYVLKDSVSVVSLIDEVTKEMDERLEAREIVLKKEAIQEYTLQRCNASLLHTMFFNLINNAVKYNRDGGSIIITGFYSEGGYTLQIRDTGVGVSPENLPFIFNRFKRLHKTDNESFGLGLPIVQTIADLHHIKIDVSSIPGKGSTFSLTFTRSKDGSLANKMNNPRKAKAVLQSP